MAELTVRSLYSRYMLWVPDLCKDTPQSNAIQYVEKSSEKASVSEKIRIMDIVISDIYRSSFR